MENTQKSKIENVVDQNEHAPTNDGIAMPMADKTHGVTHVVAPGPALEVTTYKQPPFYSPSAPTDVSAFLSRPVLISSGAFVNGSFGSLISTLFYPTQFAAAMPNITGALGFRATVCYRVEISAAPQAQGIVRLAYEYMSPNAPYSKGSFRPISAQLPGAEVNLRSASALEVKVPFVSDRDYWFFVNGNYTNAQPAFKLVLWPYAPVLWDTTTVSTPTYSIYQWFEDVELVSKSCATVAVTPQAGSGPEADHGKVSTWFRYAAKISSYAASIPSLTSIALPVSWAFDAATKIAAHFGWSKPNDGSYSGIMFKSWGRGLNTCADADFANPMSYYANNEVACLPGFAGNDFDEMSLCYLTCKPGLIATTNLGANDLRNQIKWTCPVSMSNFVYQYGNSGFAQLSCMGLGTGSAAGTNKAGYIPSPMAFFASFFDRWRGDIIFRFKFSTTKFHAGKVLIGYVPGEDVSDGVTAGGFSQAPDLLSRYNYQSVVIDLRNTTEYDFVVPFTYPSAWCDVGMSVVRNGAFGVPNTGSVFVAIIDPLYGPDNVPPNATMLVEVLGTCGLEFSQPITSQLLPLSVATAPVLVAQSGGDADFDATRYATGERILSIKQLAMRPLWVSSENTNVNGVPQANVSFFSPCNFVPHAGYYNVPTDVGDSILSRFSSAFALVRGSVIARLMPQFDGSSTTKTNWYNTMLWTKSGVSDARSAAVSVEADAVNAVRLPYYSKNNRTRTGWSANSADTSNSVNRWLMYAGGGPGAATSVGVCAGDDYQLGCFTGVPPCVTLDSDNLQPAFLQQDNYFYNVHQL